MSTNFNLVEEFHSVFEHPIRKEEFKTVFTDDSKLLKLRLDLITEEVNELKDACDQRDFTGIKDALSDILYVVYGAGHALGIDLDKCFDLVHKSNMTKACRTEDEAKETVIYIRENEKRYNPAYRQSSDGKYWIVYDQDSGKILKSKYYQAVEL
jgi:predicted HAD superfamily Cof-like phosphohydrolase